MYFPDDSSVARSGRHLKRSGCSIGRAGWAGVFYSPGRNKPPADTKERREREPAARDDGSFAVAAMLWTLALLFLVWLFPPYWLFPPFGSIGSSIGREIRANPQGLVDIAALTPFDWDELFPYTRYQSRIEICKELKLEWASCQWTVPLEIDDDSSPSLLVFRKGSDIVHREYLEQADGIIAYWPRPVRKDVALYRVATGYDRTILRRVNVDDE